MITKPKGTPKSLYSRRGPIGGFQQNRDLHSASRSSDPASRSQLGMHKVLNYRFMTGKNQLSNVQSRHVSSMPSMHSVKSTVVQSVIQPHLTTSSAKHQESSREPTT